MQESGRARRDRQASTALAIRTFAARLRKF